MSGTDTNGARRTDASHAQICQYLIPDPSDKGRHQPRPTLTQIAKHRHIQPIKVNQQTQRPKCDGEFDKK